MIKSIFLYSFVLFLFCQEKLKGQSAASENKFVNYQIWLDFYPHFYINEKIEYYGDMGYRTVVSDVKWRRIYIRPSVRYHQSKYLEFHGGLGLFYVINEGNTNRFEITPWQGVQLNWPSSENIKIKNLFKLEERTSILSSDGSASFDLRIRYKISARIEFLKKSPSSFWYVPIYTEFFLPVRDEIDELFSNQNRIGLGIGHSLSKEWRFSILYNWQKSRVIPAEELNASDNAFQIKVLKRWKTPINSID